MRAGGDAVEVRNSGSAAWSYAQAVCVSGGRASHPSTVLGAGWVFRSRVPGGKGRSDLPTASTAGDPPPPSAEEMETSTWAARARRDWRRASINSSHWSLHSLETKQEWTLVRCRAWRCLLVNTEAAGAARHN